MRAEATPLPATSHTTTPEGGAGHTGPAHVEQVVEVPTRLEGRLGEGGHVQPRHRRDLVGQHGLLDLAGQLQLTVEPLGVAELELAEQLHLGQVLLPDVGDEDREQGDDEGDGEDEAELGGRRGGDDQVDDDEQRREPEHGHRASGVQEEGGAEHGDGEPDGQGGRRPVEEGAEPEDESIDGGDGEPGPDLVARLFRLPQRHPEQHGGGGHDGGAAVAEGAAAAGEERAGDQADDRGDRQQEGERQAQGAEHPRPAHLLGFGDRRGG